MVYVLARTLGGGRREGVLSTVGTGVAGLVHTVAAMPSSRLLTRSRGVRRVQRYGTGNALIALGAYVADERLLRLRRR